VRNYLDVCTALPWNTVTADDLSLQRVERVLNGDHYGLEKIKERVLEYIAVMQRTQGKQSQILCLVGPPGVGKTSIGISIAKAMNRKLARVSLGGVRDEADIRGHRKTYIGAMPGRILAGITEAGSKNPVLLLDEIDKMASDFRGDPSAALLEVLDKEQNSAFRDHFVEVPFDLSEVLFITTANTLDSIPRPLLDRMEVLELSSYTDVEKLMIAKRHLVPKLRTQFSMEKDCFDLTAPAIKAVIEDYTREAGVRNLERTLAAIFRKASKMLIDGNGEKIRVTEKNLFDFLGVKKYLRESRSKKPEIGLVNGLAWTSVGGELLEVEVNVLDGSGKLELTGNLGDVMKESAKAAISYIRSRADVLGIAPDFYKNKDVHIHFPEGATPKDGPSAGIAVTVALVSALTSRPVRADAAMTGEITLRGRVLAIGGLKEKSMAAYRAGIAHVLIPFDNQKDVEVIDPLVKNALTFHPIKSADQALEFALLPPVSAQATLSKPIQPSAAGSSRVHSDLVQ